MSEARDNHYVAQWYQRGFLNTVSNELYYLDLNPDQRELNDGRIITMNSLRHWPTARCFYQTDLYSTFYWAHINDDIERRLFGNIDDTGSRAIRAFLENDPSAWHHHFQSLFEYIDIQKIRTPKGLDWIRSNYPDLTQNKLMSEMQSLRNMHCTFWTEGVREIVSAKNSDTKFIISDHPVTVYNHALPPDSPECTYPNEPPVSMKGTQTLFALDQNHCLILTNLEYARKPEGESPTENRTHAKGNRNSFTRTDAFIKSRDLNEEQVRNINLIIKLRAKRYIAASTEDWLYPEKKTSSDWADLRHSILPPKDELWHFGGEIFAQTEDGRTHYQDEFGRTTPENTYLKKDKPKGKVGANVYCPCGSGKKFKRCCSNKPNAKRTSWDVLSIRERNLAFFDGVVNILEMDEDKTWEAIRLELSDEKIKKIQQLFAFFWPAETEIFELLPKADGTTRALYSGIIDPRTIAAGALAMAPYFEEVIVQNPMMNPNIVNEEYNPIENPHQYKQETLKQGLLLMQLAPFIESGFVNYIPDPCAFDFHLHRQMLSMAEERRREYPIDKKDQPLLDWLHRDDFNRTIWSFSEEASISTIRRANPDIDDDMLQKLLELIEERKRADPLALLESSQITGEQAGQMMMFSMTPNLEMSLYIAQVTGAFLITDSHTIWNEFMQHQSRVDGLVVPELQKFTNRFESLKFPFSFDPYVSHEMRIKGNLGIIRDTFERVFRAAESQPDNNFTEAACNELIDSAEAAQKQAYEQYGDNAAFEETLKITIPKGGFVNTNVHRLLISSGARDFNQYSPMAILMNREFQFDESQQ